MGHSQVDIEELLERPDIPDDVRQAIREEHARCQLVEQHLRESEERLRFALNATSEGIFDWNVKTGEVFWYAASKSLDQESPAPLRSTYDDYEELVHPDDLSILRTSIREHQEKHTPIYFAEYRAKKTGHEEWRWYQAKGKVVEWDADGSPLRMVGTDTDVTDRKQIEIELRRVNDWLETSLFGGHIWLWEYDIDGDQFHSSKHFNMLMGYGEQEFVGSTEVWRQRTHPEDVDFVVEKLRALIKDEAEAESSEHRMLTASGAHRWVLARGRVALRDSDGRPLKLMGSTTDITDRKEADQRRRALEQQLHQAQKHQSLCMLAGGVAHIFSNLMTGVICSAEMLAVELGEQSEAQDMAESIRQAARRAADLSTMMLAYSGKKFLTLETIALSEHVQHVLEAEKATISRDIHLERELAKDLPAIEGDASMLSQVLRSLISNATESLNLGPGTITLRTGTVRADTAYLSSTHSMGCELEPGCYAFFEVEDSGCGMDEHTQSRMFEPFFTTKFTGRGLGLAETMGIVRSHRGALQVESQPNKGSSIRVLLPCFVG